MRLFQFILLIFRFEALVLLREVTRDVFLSWIIELYVSSYTNSSYIFKNASTFISA